MFPSLHRQREHRNATDFVRNHSGSIETQQKSRETTAGASKPRPRPTACTVAVGNLSGPPHPSNLTMASQLVQLLDPEDRAATVVSSYFHHFYPLRLREDLPALIASVLFPHEPARSRKDSLLDLEPFHLQSERLVAFAQFLSHPSVLVPQELVAFLHPYHHDFLRHHWPPMTVQVQNDAASCPLHQTSTKSLRTHREPNLGS